MRIVSVSAEAWTLPLVAPFVIAARSATEARNVRLRIETEDGPIGNGASAPVGYVTGESVESVLEALNAVGPEFVGAPIDRLGPLLARANRLLPDAPAARAGLEMALYDVWAKERNLPLWQHFGGMQDRVTTDVTIPIVSPGEAENLASAAWADGFRALKIKVGDPEGPDADLARIEAVIRIVPLVRLRIDANQAFTPDAAVQFAASLSKLGAAVDLLEQPVAKEDVAGLKYVRERITVPLFADESARSIAEALHLLQADAVDGINIKLMKSGITGALQIIALTQAFGKKLMLGCMLETGLGIAAAAQIAAGTGAFDFLDLDSHRLLKPISGLSGGANVCGDELVLENAVGWGTILPELPTN
jgi:L-alanine-DL-glutamate epimerase-like enolase superfamily enzyme